MNILKINSKESNKSINFKAKIRAKDDFWMAINSSEKRVPIGKALQAIKDFKGKVVEIVEDPSSNWTDVLIKTAENLPKI